MLKRPDSYDDIITKDTLPKEETKTLEDMKKQPNDILNDTKSDIKCTS